MNYKLLTETGVIDTEVIDVEDAVDVEVGKFYLVNTAMPSVFEHTWGDYIPLLGPLHEDNEFIKFPFMHWHIDWRFFTHARLDHVFRILSREQPAVLRTKHGLLNYICRERDIIQGSLAKRPLECKRTHLTFPPEDMRWARDLEASLMSRRACDTCPHRGISLVGAPEEKVFDHRLPAPFAPVNWWTEEEPPPISMLLGSDVTVRICPGHGLAWNKETGQLVPRHYRVKL